MLSAQNIGVSFGGFTLFDNLNFRLGQGDRVALIGKNGAGKSTLLKIIAGEQKGVFGSVKTQTGYLPQDLDFHNTGSVLEEAYKAFKEILEIEKRQDFINHQLDLGFYRGYSKGLIIELTSILALILGAYGSLKFSGLTFDFINNTFPNQLESLEDSYIKIFSFAFTFIIILVSISIKRYIMVDEYQDTNHSQYIIVKALADRFQNICVVGDDSQSIYSFRGANIQNILSFQKDYPDTKMFKLEQNYRSTEKLIERFRAKASKASMAQSLIKKLDKIDRIEIDPEENRKMKFEISG